MAKKKKKAKKRKSLVEVLKTFRKFKSLPELDKVPKELRRLNENWDSLPQLSRDLILILGRVRKISHSSVKGKVRLEEAAWLKKRGKNPQWLSMALNIVKDSKGFLSDREIARRVGVSHSTLCRNETYRNARKTYVQPTGADAALGLEKTEQP